MIRGTFTGFVSGWAGILMITFLLGIAMCCFCCYCASIWHSRWKTRRNLPQAWQGKATACKNMDLEKSNDNDINPTPTAMTNFNGSGAFTYSTPFAIAAPSSGIIEDNGTCPYPIDIAHDGIPRPQY